MFRISTRANICRKCCEHKGDEVLGEIVRAERKARRYVKASPDNVRQGVSFYARLCHVSEDFIRAELAKARP
jgi:hypothetical protein